MLGDHVDEYCERLDPSFWAEPANAFSNLGFFVVAWLIWRALANRGQAADLRALAILIALVGAGSFAFHTFATRWAMWLDVGWITVFLLVYVHRFLARIAGWRPAWCYAGVLAFVLLDTLLKRMLAFPQLNGSQMYAAALLVLTAMALWTSRQRLPSASALRRTALLFLAAVVLRSLDRSLCPVWPAGTHFAWHLINALVLYGAMQALLRTARWR